MENVIMWLEEAFKTGNRSGKENGKKIPLLESLRKTCNQPDTFLHQN